MKSKLSFLALAVLLLAAPAQAFQLWTWTGDCVTNSAGRLPVPPCHTAVFVGVTIDSYVPGTVVDVLGGDDPTTLVSSGWGDDAGASLTILQGFFRLNGVDLKFPASSGEVEGFLNTQTSSFHSSADGTWKFEAEGAAPNCGPANDFLDPFCAYTATGIDGTWRRFPWPSTLALVALGLVGLVGVYRLTEEKSSRARRSLRFRRSSATGTPESL